MSTEADIIAANDGSGGATASSATDAGEAFIRQHFVGHLEDWLVDGKLKLHVGYTGLSSFLKDAERAGLKVTCR